MPNSKGPKRSSGKIMKKKRAPRKQRPWKVDHFESSDEDDNVERIKIIKPRQYLVPLHTIKPATKNVAGSEGGYVASADYIPEDDLMADDCDENGSDTTKGSENDSDIASAGDISYDRVVNEQPKQGDYADSTSDESDDEGILTDPKEKNTNVGDLSDDQDESMSDDEGESMIEDEGESMIEDELESTSDDDDDEKETVGDVDRVSTANEGQNDRNSEESHHDQVQPLTDVWKILKDNPYSDEVIEKYDGSKELSNRERTTVVDAIVTYALRNKIHLSAKLMTEISLKICRVFPNETPSTYFKISAGNRKSGKLFSRYYYKRRLYNCLVGDNRPENNKKCVTISTEVQNSIDILKDEGGSTECYIENWDKTFDFRMQKMEMYETLEDMLNDWPIVGRPIGPTLIDMDFQKVHGNKTITPEKWNSFFARNWLYFMKNIKNAKGLTSCNKIARMTDGISKDAALSYLLHFLVPPALCSRMKKNEERPRKKPKGRKPSIVDSCNTLLKFVKDDDIDLVITNRRTQFELNKIHSHPYIIGVGCTKYKIKHFYVIIGEVKIKVFDFVTALNCCLKMFILFKIPYPPESKAVWIILNKFFFDTNASPLMTARLCTLYNDMQK